GGHGEQLCNGGSADDALVQGWAVYDHELNLDRFGSLIDPKGDDQVDVTPRLGGCAVEPLEIGAH
ncbi:hypothetical protein A2U01_0068157, partial [Trifolium medium]|nr:hypothetical protein [Trifolium medium]